MRVIRFFFQFILGLVFGMACGIALAPLFASISDGKGVAGFYVVALGVAILVAFAPTARRAFGRGFLLLGVAVFLLPLSTLILSGVVSHDVVSGSEGSDRGMAAAGSFIAGGIMTGIAGIFGFILGFVFLVIGLVLALGGRREVVVVERR
jgi:hypothetical protein